MFEFYAWFYRISPSVPLMEMQADVYSSLLHLLVLTHGRKHSWTFLICLFSSMPTENSCVGTFQVPKRATDLDPIIFCMIIVKNVALQTNYKDNLN